MQNKKYYIESITFPDDELENIGTAIISVDGHGACIEVYGKNHELTERVIKVINGLNAKE